MILHTRIAIACLLLLLTSPRLNAQTITWQRTYDGGYLREDEGYDLLQTSNGGFYFCGKTLNPVPTIRRIAILFKLNSTGDVVWKKLLSSPSDDVDCYSMCDNGNSGCIVSFTSSNHISYVNVDSSGIELWRKVYPGSAVSIYDLKVDANGKLFSCGVQQSGGYVNMYLSVLDSSGNMIVERISSDTLYKQAFRFNQDNGEEMFLSGTLRLSVLDTPKVFLSQINEKGNVEWETNFNIPGKSTVLYQLQKLDGELFLGGAAKEYGNTSSSRIFLANTDLKGKIKRWSIKDYGFTDHTPAFSTWNNGKIAVGFTRRLTVDSSRAISILLDLNGSTIYERRINYTNEVYILAAKCLKPSGYAFFGVLSSIFINDEFFLFRSDSLLGGPFVNIAIPKFEGPIVDQLEAYPNPFNANTKLNFEIREPSSITIDIYDVSGKLKIRKGTYYLGRGKHSIDLMNPNLSSGMYIAVIILNGRPASYVKLAMVK